MLGNVIYIATEIPTRTAAAACTAGRSSSVTSSSSSRRSSLQQPNGKYVNKLKWIDSMGRWFCSAIPLPFELSLSCVYPVTILLNEEAACPVLDSVSYLPDGVCP